MGGRRLVVTTITTVVDLEKALSPKNSCRTTLQTIFGVCAVCGRACVCKSVCVCVGGGNGVFVYIDGCACDPLWARA